MSVVTIRYEMVLPDGSRESFSLPLDSVDLSLAWPLPEVKPEWTALDFHQCPNCPLSPEIHPDCLLAIRIVEILKHSNRLVSHDRVHLEVVTDERVVSQETTAQRAFSGLLGLVFATSGCPHSMFLRPMARFHLPLASEEETIYRATSMYLLAQYFLKKEGKKVDFDLGGLLERYKNLQIVNRTMVDRLKAASETDSSINAIVLLDAYAKFLPFAIKESLEELRFLFASYFQDNG